MALGLIGLALSVAGFEFGDAWAFGLGVLLGCAGTATTAYTMVAQYFASRPYDYPFTGSSWEPLGPDEVGLRIPASEHGKGRSPSVIIYEDNAITGEQSEVTCDVRIAPSSGDVVVAASGHTSISGKVVIK